MSRTAPSDAPASEKVLAAEAVVLQRLTRQRTRNRPLVPPESALSEAYRGWVQAALAAAQRAGPVPAAPEGFVLETLADGDLWLLAEAQDQRRGAGALLLRVGEARPIAIEAPHTYYDAGTLPISLALFVRSRARALLLNTVHRAAGAPEAEHEEVIHQGRAPSDVAHLEVSLFRQAHLALLAREPELLTVQIHGYGDGPSSAFAAVLSAARSKLMGIERIAEGLATALGEPVAVYPRDTNELGGTTNRQALDCRTHGRPFLHVELSAHTRRRGSSDAAWIEVLAQRLVHAQEHHRAR